MKRENSGAENARLTALLHESRPMPALPPRFAEGVWRRIEESEATLFPSQRTGWFDRLVVQILRPRFILPGLAALLVAGSLLGAHDASQMAKRVSLERYLVSVAPNPFR